MTNPAPLRRSLFASWDTDALRRELTALCLEPNAKAGALAWRIEEVAAEIEARKWRQAA